MVSEIIWHEYLHIALQSYTTGKGSEIPGLEDNASCLEEMKEWIIDHATITVLEEEKATPDSYHVKVEWEDLRLGHETMIFNATPDEKYSSLRARVATHLGLFTSTILILPRQRSKILLRNVAMGYSHYEMLWKSQKT